MSETVVLPDHQNGYSRTPGDLPPGMSGNTPMPPLSGVSAPVETQAREGGENEATATSPTDSWLLQKAREIYVNSTDYLNANITLGWERNLYHFHSEHGPATAYVRKDWNRSRTFRPKTRANVKSAEAAVAAAAFSTQDYLDVKPKNPSKVEQAINAEICKSLAQHRLEESEYSWFLTTVGAFQDTKVYGICVSHQYWKYEQIEETVPAYDDEGNPITGQDETTGETVPMGESRMRVLHDHPVVDLIEPENFRFDPMCDWRNPAHSSPYIVYLWGLYAGDALEMMDKQDPKTGQPLWRKYSLQQILATRKENVDNRTRRARESHHRIDPVNMQEGNEFTMVWAHLNIVRIQGVDIAWWTLGTDLVLTDPIPLTEMYPHLRPGERPFVVGFSVIEAHRNYPTGDVGQSAVLQEEINAVANQRLDNVKLVLNKRYFIRRGSQIDLEALMRNVPGGGVMVNEPEKDVQVIPTQDVTGSSYQEQDRLAVEFDELVGGFSPGSVQSNRKLNETVGGMDHIATAAGSVQDYGITIFFQTWMEPVLKQIIRMEQMYETDTAILEIAGDKSSLFLKSGQSQITDQLLNQDLAIRVNVGLGNTDPMQRVQKLIFGVSQAASLPGMAPKMKSQEIADEIFGSLGYKDATRFFKTDQEMQQEQQQNPPQPPPEVQVKMKELEIRDNDNKMRDAREKAKMEQDKDIADRTLAQQLDIETRKLAAHTQTKQDQIQITRDTVAVKESNRLAEMNMQRAHEANKPR